MKNVFKTMQTVRVYTINWWRKSPGTLTIILSTQNISATGYELGYNLRGMMYWGGGYLGIYNVGSGEMQKVSS